MEINYDRIKSNLSIEKVLNQYGLSSNLTRTQNKLYGSCPIHKGDNPQAFHVDLNKNLWNCFTHCGGGSVIDLLMEIEKINVYQAGILGEELLTGKSVENLAIIKSYPEKVNPPLEFRLNLIPDHPYITDRKITKETARNFEIGCCSYGIMKNRIAIPIHDLKNNLIAYCGRAIDETKPKYKFPKGFKKSEVVYNLNRVINSDKKELVIVEGFFDVLRLYQAGIDAGAIMGSSMSKSQFEQLENLERKIILMFDGNKAGRRGMKKALSMFNNNPNVNPFYLPNWIEPDDLKEGFLRELIL